MRLEVCTVGGFDEVGRNMVAVRCGHEAVIIDMGIYLPMITAYQQEGTDYRLLPVDHLIEGGAIPDDRVIADWHVIAIVLGHCHLDHIAAVPFLAQKYNVPIYGTPFTLGVLQATFEEHKIRLTNPLQPVLLNRLVRLSENFTLELVNTPHSTLQCGITVLHTKAGIVMYTNDFKMDDTPILSAKPNYKRLEQLRDEGISLLVCDSLYAPNDNFTPSESVAREKLRTTLLEATHTHQAIFVTCFSSHVERIKSLVDFAREMGREVLILGRSMARYLRAAQQLQLIDFLNSVQLCSYSAEIEGALKNIAACPEKYLVICTGGQGEPNSILNRILHQEFRFRFRPGDTVIFSCRTIPVEPNISNRAHMEETLKKHEVRLYLDVHVSGHASGKDLRNFIKLVQPRHVIPAHGGPVMAQAMHTLCTELGMPVHIMRNGERFVVSS